MINTESIAGLIAVTLLSAFLLGLANSIGKTPFWVIVVLVLIGAWVAWYQDTVKNPPVD